MGTSRWIPDKCLLRLRTACRGGESVRWGANSADGSNLCVEKNRGQWTAERLRALRAWAQITNKVRPSLLIACLLCEGCALTLLVTAVPWRPHRVTAPLGLQMSGAISCHSPIDSLSMSFAQRNDEEGRLDEHYVQDGFHRTTTISIPLLPRQRLSAC